LAWNPFKRKALTGTPPVIDAIRGGWTTWPLLGGGSRQRILDAYNTAQSANYAWVYRNSPAVRTVVDVLARNIGQLDLRCYEEISEAERQPRPDHPAALSLRYPSETETSDAFIRGLFIDFLLYSNAYALLVPAPRNQLSFFRVPAHMVEVRGASLFVAEGYRVWGRDGQFRDYTPEQILHWHGENPEDPRFGLSRLDTLRGVIAEEAALQAAIVELANSGMTEPVAFVRPLEAPEWSNPARHGFEEDLNNRLRRQNSMPIVLEEGITPVKIGTSPRDAQSLDVRRFLEGRVASAYGVPLGMVGLDDNLEQAQKIFYADTLPPWCEEFTRMLNQRVLVRAYGWTDGCFEFNLHEKQIGPEMIKTLISAAGGPIYLRDEARALLSMAPLPDGQGAEIITPMNVTEGGKPSPQVMPVQDPNKPEQDGSYREEEPKALTKWQTQLKDDESVRELYVDRDMSSWQPAATSRRVSLAKAEEYERLPQFHPTFKTEHERQLRHIDAFHAVTAKHFGRLERILVEKTTKQLKSERFEARWDRLDHEFAGDIHKTLEQVVESEGEYYALKLAGQFDTRLVKNYVRAMAEGAAEGINGKIRDEIDEHGLEAALARFSQHVESSSAGLGAGATRFAREEAAKRAPGVEHRVKVWVPNTNRHAQFAGNTVPLGADWPAGFAPGTAPGCKCSMSIF
jgi:HK97 family phage portal protein